MKFKSLLITAIAAPLAVTGAVKINSFESGAERDLLQRRGPVEPELIGNSFPSDGRFHARMRVMPQPKQNWPGLGITVPPELGNWKEAEYLVFDAVNPTENEQQVLLLLASEGQAFNRGYSNRVLYLQPGTHTTVCVDLTEAGRKIDLSRVNSISLCLPEARRGADLAFDNFRLTGRGETLPEVKPELLHKLPGGTYREGMRPPQSRAELYSFETPEELRDFQLIRPGEFSREKRYATDGEYALHYRSPVHADGANEWRALRMFPSFDRKNWTGYDWLVFDVVNPTGKLHHIRFFLTDGKTPFRSGYRSDGFNFKPWSHQRVVIPLSRAAEKIDLADIRMLHFIVYKPQQIDCELYFDNFHLLKPSAVSKPVPPELQREILRLNQQHSGFSDRELRDLISAEEKKFAADTAYGRESRSRLAELRRELDSLSAVLNDPDLTLEKFLSLQTICDHLPHRIRRVNAELAARAEAERRKLTDGSFAFGADSAMVRLPPVEVPFKLNVTGATRLSLARGEKEGVQIFVLAGDRKLSQVTVRVGPLKNDQGTVFPADSVQTLVVGSLKTTIRPSYPVPYVGYYPHVFLDFFDTLDVDPHVLQAFYLRFRAPRNQPPGVYRGQVEILSAGNPIGALDLELYVRRYELPNRPIMPTATSNGDDMRLMAGRLGVDWNRLRLEYADFMADFGVEPDGIYRPSGPDFKMMLYLKAQGRHAAFNLCSFEQMMKSKTIGNYVREAVERIRPHYRRARELGLLDTAYVYGFDESPREKWATLAACADAIHREFPGLKVMTTTHDPAYGLRDMFKNVDIWCPVINFYDAGQAAEARRQGRKVWWYLSPSASRPYPNVWVESDAIDQRIMHGFMAAKLRPDGYLYYAVNLWGDNEPLTEPSAFLKWNPNSFASLNGDGCIVYAGPGARPLASFPLENMRDGFEDLAAYRLLERAAAEAGKNPGAWPPDFARRAAAVLEIPESVVRNQTDFTRSGTRLKAYRAEIDALLDEAAPLPFAPDEVVLTL